MMDMIDSIETDQDYDDLLTATDEVREAYENKIKAAETKCGKKSPRIKYLEPDKQIGLHHEKPKDENFAEWYHNHPAQVVSDFRMHDYYEYESCGDYLFDNNQRFLWRVSFVDIW